MENKTLLFALFCFFFSVSGNLFAQEVGDITVDITAQSCYQVADGSISLVFNDSEDPNPCETYEFSWFFEGELIEDIDNPCMLMGLEPGEYSLIVDNDGCTAEGNFIVDAATAAQITVTSEITKTCYTQNNGEVIVTVNPLNPPYTFSWLDIAGTSVSSIDNSSGLTMISNQPAGEYSLTVTDNNGCTYSEEYSTVQVVPIPMTYIGKVMIETGNGELIYEGKWDAYGSICSNYTGGTINVPLNSLLNESLNVTVKTNNPMPALTLDAFGETIYATPSNPEETEFLFSFSPGILNSQVSSGLIDEKLKFSGEDYNNIPLIDLREESNDLNECAELGYILPNCSIDPEDISLGIDDVHEIYLSCLGEQPEFVVDYTNDVVKITNYGGSSYQYYWSGPSVGNPNGDAGQANILPGEYCVTITNETDCISENCVYVYGLEVNIDYEICPDESETEVCAEVLFGTGVYEYTWFVNGVEYNTECLSNIPVGSNIELIVKDVVTGFNLNEPVTGVITLPTELSISETIDAGCDGENDSEICLSVTGGISPYTYAWSNNFSSACSSYFTTGSEVCVTVTDNCGTEIVECYTPTYEPLEFIETIVTDANSGCANGTIETIVSGGNPDYTYYLYQYPSYNLIDVSSSSTFYNVNAGKYGIQVWDECGNRVGTSVKVGGEEARPYEVDFRIKEIKHVCEEDAFEGFIALEITTGLTSTTSLEYMFFGPDGFSQEGSITMYPSGIVYQFNNLQSGSYAYIIFIDDCDYWFTFDIEVDNIPDIDAEIMNICSQGGNGMIELIIPDGSDFEFEWFDGSTSSMIEISEVGEYNVIVKNIIGCEREFSFSVEETQILVTPTVVPTSLIDALPLPYAVGSISLQITGENPPFETLWEDGTTETTIDELTTGFYSVTVTDNNGCISETEIFVPACPVTSLFVDRFDHNQFKSCLDGPGWIRPTALSTGGPLTYIWTGPNGFTAETKDIANLTEEGTYCLEMTDVCGISKTTCVDLLCNADFLEQGKYVKNGSCGDDNRTLEITKIEPAEYSGEIRFTLEYFSNGQYSTVGVAQFSTSIGTTDVTLLGSLPTTYPFEIEDGLYRLTMTDINGNFISGETIVSSEWTTMTVLAANDNDGNELSVCDGKCKLSDFIGDTGEEDINMRSVAIGAREGQVCGSLMSSNIHPEGFIFVDLEYFPTTVSSPCQNGGTVISQGTTNRTWDVGVNSTSSFLQLPNGQCGCLFEQVTIETTDLPNQIGSFFGSAEYLFVKLNCDGTGGSTSDPDPNDPVIDVDDCPDGAEFECSGTCSYIQIEGDGCYYDVRCTETGEILGQVEAETIMCYQNLLDDCATAEQCIFDEGTCTMEVIDEEYDCSNPLDLPPCPCNTTIEVGLPTSTCIWYYGGNCQEVSVLIDDPCLIIEILDTNPEFCEPEEFPDINYCPCSDNEHPNFTGNNADERSGQDDIDDPKNKDWVKPYPNPFSDILTVEVDLDRSGEVKIELIGLTGRVVSSSIFSGEEGENTFTLNPIRDGQQGIFILKVTAPDGKEHYQKVTHIDF